MRCQSGLSPGGLICVKENITKSGVDLDSEDSSVTRSGELLCLKVKLSNCPKLNFVKMTSIILKIIVNGRLHCGCFMSKKGEQGIA